MKHLAIVMTKDNKRDYDNVQKNHHEFHPQEVMEKYIGRCKKRGTIYQSFNMSRELCFTCNNMDLLEAKMHVTKLYFELSKHTIGEIL